MGKYNKAYSKADWPAIKQAYVGGEGSLRQLAKRFNVCFSTVGKRSEREGWHDQRQRHLTLAKAGFSQALEQSASAEGEEVGQTAFRFLKRVTEGLESLLDMLHLRIEASEGMTAKDFKILVECLDKLSGQGRELFGMTHTAPSPPANIIRINVLNPGAVWLAKGPVPEAFKPAQCIEIESEDKTENQPVRSSV
jgi:hypothetical protein